VRSALVTTNLRFGAMAQPFGAIFYVAQVAQLNANKI
jgi:hypothetical protein